MNPFGMGGGGGGGGQISYDEMQRHDAERRAAVFSAKLEMEGMRNATSKMSDQCFRKCVTTWQEPDLTKGEGLCVDRCVLKYVKMMELVSNRSRAIGEKLQTDMAENAALAERS